MLVFGVLTSVLIGVAASALGQGPQELGASTAALVTQIKTILNADSVLGTPREFDGMKIVPIVNFFFGFGSGSGASRAQQQGIGGGGGGGITPASLLVITKDGEVRVVAAKVGMVGEVLKTAIPEVLEFLKSRRERAEPGSAR
jgi:uncharacterized spore protein YtfJ